MERTVVQVSKQAGNAPGLEAGTLSLSDKANYMADPRGRGLYSAHSGRALKTSMEDMNPGMSGEWGPVMQSTISKMCLKGEKPKIFGERQNIQ